MTNWVFGHRAPTMSVAAIDGDMYLNSNTGDVYLFNNGSWAYVSNIQGRPGPIFTEISDSVVVKQLSTRKFSISNINTENREIYQWILGTTHEYDTIEDDIINGNIIIEFKQNDGAVDFKLTWFRT